MKVFWSIWDAAWRTIWWLSYPLMKSYFLMIKSTRTRVLIERGDQILLIRSVFSRQNWSLPGGGPKRGEKLTVAAVRELAEEVGVNIQPEELVEIAKMTDKTEDSVGYTIILFWLRNMKSTPKIVRRWEIIEFSWFNRGKLPPNRSRLVDAALEATAVKGE